MIRNYKHLLDKNKLKEAAFSLASDLLGESLVSFPSMLDDNVNMAIFEERYCDKAEGKNSVIHYWNNWIEKEKNLRHFHIYKVAQASTFTTEVLQIDYYDQEKRYIRSIIVNFSFDKKGIINYIFFINERAYYGHFVSGHFGLLDMFETLSIDILSTRFFEEEHLACPECGTKPSRLIWHLSDGEKESFCTNCHKLVEKCSISYNPIDNQRLLRNIETNSERLNEKLSLRKMPRIPTQPLTSGFQSNDTLTEYISIIENCYKQIKRVASDKHETHVAYYNLGLVYYRISKTGHDLLTAYAYLNRCPFQNDDVINLKACICKKWLSKPRFDFVFGNQIMEDYIDLPFNTSSISII